MENNCVNKLEITYYIADPTPRNQKYLVYGEKKYKINFDLFVMNCNYFYKNQKEYQYIESIPLLNEETKVNIPEEAIESFILSCQNERFVISKTSVLPLQYLSTKYEYPRLTKITNDFIEQHSHELAIQSLLFKTENNKKNSVFSDEAEANVEAEEEIISKNIMKYIDDEMMLKIDISILNRIIKKAYSNNKELLIENEKIVDFMFKALDKHGKDASILFNNIDFKYQNICIIKRLIDNYSDKFDFNMINSTLSKTTTELTSELTKQREKYEFLFFEMKKTFEEQMNEILSIKNDQTNHIKSIEERYQKQIIEMKKTFDDQKNEILSMKIEQANQIKSIEEQYQKKIIEMEDEIKKLKEKNESFQISI